MSISRHRRRRLMVGACLLTLATVHVRAETIYTLDACFRLAVGRSDSLAGDVELVHQAEEGIRQARANFMPTLSLSANMIRQEAPQGALGQSLFPSTQKTVQLTATQSLFKGFQDLAVLREKNSLKRASAQAWRQAYLQLYQDTAEAYFAVLEDEHDLRNYEREVAADRGRHEQLAGMQKFGRAREADVVSLEASIANVEASAASTRGTLGADREALAFLTGIDPSIALVDVDSAPALSTPLSSWLAKLDERPDVHEAHENWEAAEHAVAAAAGNHLPTATLTGDYYLTRPGAYSDVHWDAQLNLTLPIFSGGATQAQVRREISFRTGEQIAYDLARRRATESIGSDYRAVAEEIERASRLAEATRLYDRYYQLLLKDNQAGIATNVDVLLALSTAEQTRRTADHARLSAHYDYIRLRIASADAEILAQASGGKNASAD